MMVNMAGELTKGKQVDMRHTPAAGNQAVHTFQPFPRERAEKNARKSREDQEVYNSRWRKLSKLFLAHNPMCETCLQQGILTEARHSDHIKSAKAYPELRYDEANLSPKCISCHSRRTRQDQLDAAKGSQ